MTATSIWTSALLSVAALSCSAASTAPPVVAPAGPPLSVVGMSLDPSTLESAGIGVETLKALATSELNEAGIPTTADPAPSVHGPRLAISVPLNATDADVAVFIYLQYQIPTPSQDTTTPIIYAATWSRWWGARTTHPNMRAEVTRGLHLLLQEFLRAHPPVTKARGGA